VLEVVVKPPTRPARRRTNGPGCLWPFGDPGSPEFHFCGEPEVPGKPYCDAHCAKAYIVKSRARSEAA
jgi:GcrA cell cycle regulator